MKCRYQHLYPMIALLIVALSIAGAVSIDVNAILQKSREVYLQKNAQARPLEETPSTLPFRGKLKLSPEMEYFEMLQLLLEVISSASNLYNLPAPQQNETLQALLNNPDVQGIIKECNVRNHVIQCDGAWPYRTIDGTCNNLKHPEWGSTNTKNERFLPPDYEGPYDLRKSVTGEDLPTPRTITLGLLKDEDHPSKDISFLFPLFGQLVDHDLTNTPITKINSITPECCDGDRDSQMCSPLLFKTTDPFYSSFKKTCVEFVRSAPYPTCNFEKRTPMNSITAFLDASFAYGYNNELAVSLRTMDDSGKLKIQQTIHGKLLPPDNNINDDVCPSNETSLCFKAGDDRVNEHFFLTILQTLFVREHNRVADILHGLNPKWKDEKLYQESRKIVGAELQDIFCTEYLPTLVGPHYMKAYGLCKNSAGGTKYDDSVNPTILTEFSTAAYRLHSMIAHKFDSKRPDLSVSEAFSNPIPVHEGDLDGLLSGVCRVPAQVNDRAIITDLTQFLYKFPFEKLGIDLASINIQRGRDHGLPPYVKMAEMCSDGKMKFSTFEDLKQTMPQDNIALLKDFYKDVKDIDLFVGLIMETSTLGSVSGPTGSCIMSTQFQRVINGDRFFYSHKNQDNSFTPDQLKSIKTSSLAKIICENTYITEIPSKPLLIPSRKNRMKDCDTIYTTDFQPWKDAKAN